ncbi:antibiotic biosynthesis monooxygenase family protein [Actinopolymorpha pittospori]|uniref:Heme-degrading monooxygenase HmoA n=1 Tax=Actinopolymorpha pittospori TaxID=648752 RepID=A0A927MTA1_9ACTN|nr:antibiotic biosynthesis monooxygenase family protein [Actinopolymorpha pittospori]MBE1605921.1 heme-degrading monooxygenase HmoA [Actinopolymorpha pittospori]
MSGMGSALDKCSGLQARHDLVHRLRSDETPSGQFGAGQHTRLLEHRQHGVLRVTEADLPKYFVHHDTERLLSPLELIPDSPFHMDQIAVDEQVVTLINVFTVTPEDQQGLVDMLVEATEQVMSKQPGYIAANIHRSIDGTRVANYAQWRSREDFQALASNPEAAAHMRRAAAVATFEPALYEVVFTHHA